MIALALVIETGDRHLGAPRADAKARRGLPFGPAPIGPLAEPAGHKSRIFAHLRDIRRIGPDTDDATRRVPEQRRCGPPQDFDPIDFAKLEVRELTLPVGQRLGNAVDQDFDAADGKRGATPEAADGDALILRDVVALGGVDARQIPEGFLEAPRRSCATDLVTIDGLDGLWH